MAETTEAQNAGAQGKTEAAGETKRKAPSGTRQKASGLAQKAADSVVLPSGTAAAIRRHVSF